jgi:hypothetical protein
MTETTKYPAEIAEAINAVMGEVDYVQKRGENKFHGYKFAAVGDLLAKLQPAMAKHGLIIIQNEIEHALSPNGGVMEVKYAFTLAHKSGVVWPDRPVHTGMAAATNSKGGFDDKCVNKCMTAARKYFLLALFQIPTGEDADPDADQEREAPRTTGRAQQPQRAAPPPRDMDAEYRQAMGHVPDDPPHDEPEPAAPPRLVATPHPKSQDAVWKAYAKKLAEEAQFAPSRAWLTQFQQVNSVGIKAIRDKSEAMHQWLTERLNEVDAQFAPERETVLAAG